MLPTGLIVSGYYLGSERTTDKEGKPQDIVGVATGISSVRVYMAEKQSVADRGFGDSVALRCRAYAGKNGVVFVDGEFVEV